MPDDLDWDLWLGPAPERPYADGYHPFDWRGFWDFGTGALGDMGCHILDMPLFALDAGAPLAVEAECEDATDESPPTASTVRYRFAAGAQNDELDVVWTDGGRLPPEDVHRRLGISQRRLRAHDCVVFGSEGALLFDHLDATDNVAFGMGGALLQQLNRDTQKFALKCSAARVNGQWSDVYKDPVTDKGKMSKRGRMTLLRHREYGSFKTVPIPPEARSLDDLTLPMGYEDALVTVWEGGRLVTDHKLADVRARADAARL